MSFELDVERRPRIVNLSVEWPSDRRGGGALGAVMRVDRRLKSGKLDEVPLIEAELIRLIAQAASALATLRGVRP